MWQTFNTNILDLWEVEKVEIYGIALAKSSQIWICSQLFFGAIYQTQKLFDPNYHLI